jgi:hypothetical protein
MNRTDSFLKTNAFAGFSGNRLAVMVLAAALLLNSACDSTTTPPVGEDDYYQGEMWPSTHEMNEADMAAVVSIDDNGTFTFTKGSPILVGLAPKHVLLAGETTLTPRGTLRRVTEITEYATTVEVKTEQAKLQQAFKSLHAKFTRPVDLNASDIIWDTAPGAKILTSNETTSQSGALESRSLDTRSLVKRESGGQYFGPFTLDYYPFDGDNDSSTKEDQIHVYATMEGGIEYQFGIDFNWPDLGDVFSGDPLPEIVVGYSVKAGAKARLTFDGVAKLSFIRNDNLGHADLGGFWIGPLYFTVSVDLLSKIEGGASSRFIMTTGAGANFETSASYSTDDGGSFVPPTATWDAPDSTITATENAWIKASIGPRLRLALYDIFGPHVSVWVFGELSADSSRDPCWDLRAGVYGDIGIDLTIWGETIADYTKDFDIWDTSIASGACDPDPDAPDVPDLIEPLFTPWSVRIVDTVTSWDLDRDFTSLEPTVDGHWLVAGSGSNTLSKLTNDGERVWSRQYEQVNATIPMPVGVNRAINTRDLGIFATTYWPMLLLKLDADGGVVKAMRPDVEFQPVKGLQVLLESDDGSIYVGGPYDWLDSEKTDAWIYKLDADGNLLWSRTWGRETITEWVTGIVALGDDIVVIGQSFGLDQDPAHQSFAMRLSADGDAKWIKEIKIPGSNGPSFRKAILSHDGDIIAGGSYGYGGPNALVVKIKEDDGTLGWVNGSFGGGLGIDVTDLFQLSDGGYILAGLWWTGGTDHLWIARTDSVGAINWLKKYDDGVEDGSPSIVMTGDGGMVLAGYTEAGVDRHSMWVSRIPIKTGDMTFNDGLTTATNEPKTDAPAPTLEFTESSVGLVNMPFSLVEDTVESTKTNPTVTKLSP